MVTVFLTRRQYDTLCGKWEINGEEQRAYLFAKKRKWTVEGVRFDTDNARLLEMILKIKSTDYIQ